MYQRVIYKLCCVGFTAKHPELKDHSAHIEYTRSLGFGPEVQKRVLMGAFVLTAGYVLVLFK